MITVDDCLNVLMDLGDCQKASRSVAPKLRKLLAEEAAHILLVLIEDHEEEEYVSAILERLDNAPINYFDSILDYNSKLAEIYNNL